MENFKVNVDLPKTEIAKIAKEVIRDIIEEDIRKIIADMNINSIVAEKSKSIESKLNGIIKKETENTLKSLKWDIRNIAKEEARKVILEQIKEKPLSGNIYLKISAESIETDYDY